MKEKSNLLQSYHLGDPVLTFPMYIKHSISFRNGSKYVLFYDFILKNEQYTVNLFPCQKYFKS